MNTLERRTASGQSLSVAQADATNAPLIVYIDFKSPYAYLAIEPTRRMLKTAGLVADWRPFVLNIGSYLGTAKLAKDGKVEKQNRSQEQWSGVKYAYFDCRRYANLTDLTIRGTVKIWDTNLPALGMWWLKLHEDLAAQNTANGLLQRYIDAVYQPFWRRELDAEDLEAIVQVLELIGAPSDGFRDFATGEGMVFNDAMQQQVFNDGVYGVPTYRLPGHTDASGTPSQFFGREHLPRIAWMLEGENGLAPDVAYQLASELDTSALQKSATQPGVAQGMTRLPVYFDFKSPASYLALPTLLELKKHHGVDVSWHPIDHKPLHQPAQQTANEDRASAHRRIRGEYIAADLQRYAPHTLRDIYLSTDCSYAHMGLLWLAEAACECVSAYVEAVFVALWRDHQDIESIAAITELLVLAVGARPLDMAAWQGFLQDFLQHQGDAALAAAYDQAAANGVTSAPTFFLGDEPFQGRAHLPLLLARLRAGV